MKETGVTVRLTPPVTPDMLMCSDCCSMSLARALVSRTVASAMIPNATVVEANSTDPHLVGQAAEAAKGGRALLILSALLGAINLSRAVSDPDLSREILYGVRDQLIGLANPG